MPKSTLIDKLQEKHEKTVGRPKALSDAEEEVFKQRLLLMGTWGYPLTRLELQKQGKDYLDSAGKTVTRFKDNKPGRD